VATQEGFWCLVAHSFGKFARANPKRSRSWFRAALEAKFWRN
jgi:hypothetical protein